MAGTPGPPTAPVTNGRRWRFAVVLLASILLAVAQPLAAGLFGELASFDVFFSLLIIAVLLSAFETREHRRTAISLGMAALVGVWVSHGLAGPAGRIALVATQLLAVSFFAFTLYSVLRAILTRQVTGDAIFGTICGYLLLGIIWSLLYSAVDTAFPGSFHLLATQGGTVAAARPDRGTLAYFSFVTLATLGYGDVTPVTPLARTLAWIEAVAGQFYLAILVAGLVGFKVTQALRE
jgi:voltage-gated potassium channel